jgi:hypothetical protein
LNFSLSSALIGAFITAIFAYLVRLIIVRRSDKKRQQRFALLYLVRLNQIIALKRAIEFCFKAEINSMKEKIKGYDPYPLHLGAVKAESLLKNIANPSAISNIPGVRNLIDISKNWLEKDFYLGFKIEDELLAHLPSDTVMHYHFFIGRISELSVALMLWINAIKSGDFSCFDSNTIYKQITGFKKLIDSTEALRSSLIVKAGISKKVAVDILSKQAKYYGEEILLLQRDQKIMDVIKQTAQIAQTKPVETAKASAIPSPSPK